MARCKMKDCKGASVRPGSSVFQLCSSHLDVLGKYVNEGAGTKDLKMERQGFRYRAARRLWGWS